MVFGLSRASAQSAADSLAIVSAQWKVTTVGKGMKGMCAAFERLYGGPQYVSIVEIEPRQKHRAGISFSREMKPLSKMAEERKAVAAINGSYYDMGKGNSVTFLKEDRSVIDTTTTHEFQIRVTGAVAVRKGKLRLLPWSRSIERGYKKKVGTVLASGPLMLRNGRYADWSKCALDFITTKHPRSAIAVTKDKRVLLITVDGRSWGNAIGMSIPELAHLVKVLGGRTALNLDGGGSTTLYLDGKILNHPCDNRQFDHVGERSIPNMIYFR
ncbi:MAG: phosphodiester glycosidase family protein [Prevotella sp.]|nr:phosphodiester glycosidase family protein [Prevotella sp.]